MHRTSRRRSDAEIGSSVVEWEKLPWSFVQQFLDAPVDTTNMDPELERLLRPIKWIGAGDLTFTRVGETLYRKERPDFFAVYLRGMDAMGISTGTTWCRRPYLRGPSIAAGSNS